MTNETGLKSSLPLINTVVAVLGFAIVIVQLSLALQQMQRTERSLRAQYLTDLHARAFDAPRMRAMMHRIELGKFRFEGLFERPEELEDLVGLLSFLELLGQLETLGMLEMNDIENVFGYYIRRVYRSQEVQSYIAFLRRTDRIRFRELERIATALGPWPE